MSNGDLFNLMDVTMQQLLETFPDPRKPGADENPPRNARCGLCGYWYAKGMPQWHEEACRKVRGVNEPEEPNQ